MLIKAFRLFVSSTFADFAEEREVLQDKVFPMLDAHCAAKGYEFYPLDLRWGISEEAGRDQRSADICLEEVEAAKSYPPPNFLILLGDRYGWVPLPFAIARDEFEAILVWLAKCGDREGSQTLRYFYRHDDNRLVSPGLKPAGPDVSAYVLRSRVDDLLNMKTGEAWKFVEDKLRATLQKAVDGLLQEGRIVPAAREKYVLSLTEREIRCNLDTTPQNARGAEAIAVIRTLDGHCSALHESDPQSVAAVTALRQRVERTLDEDRIVRCTATCDAVGKLDPTYLAIFSAAIEAKLKSAIDRHMAKVEAIERGHDYALQAEWAEHGAFRAEKLNAFVGRENNLDAIARYVASDATRPLVLHGPSGSGKTSLMARAIVAAEEAGHAPLVTRFIGASANSSDLRALLLSVIDDLATHGFVEKPTDFGQDINKFLAQFKALLASISGSAVIFLDALDQLVKPYRLDWLPGALPKGVKVVLSVLDDQDYEADSEVYRLLWQRLPADAFLTIEPLSQAQGQDILLALEAQAKRRLRDGQREFILYHFEAAGASPLYLRTAFEIAKGWRSWEADADQHVLAADTAGLITQFMADLTSEHHHEPELVTHTLGFLAAAKDGMSAKELIEVLSNNDSVMRAISTEQHGHRTKKLPPSVWVRLQRALRPFLTNKRIHNQVLLHFFHREVTEVARTRHYEPAKAGLHTELVKYFEGRAAKRDGHAVYENRSLSELPYQLHHVGDAPHTARLNDILLSPDWMQQKLAASASPLPLIEDYRAYAPYEAADRTAVALVGRALAQSASVTARHERQLIAQLLGRLNADMAPGMSEVMANARRVVHTPALLPKRPTLTPGDSALLWTLEGHRSQVNAVAFSPDGTRIVSGSEDTTLRLWDVASGAAVGPPIEGHSDWVNAVAFSPDGTRIVSGSSDRTLRLWDAASGAAVGPPIEGCGGAVRAVAFSPDGTRIVSGFGDRTLRLWDAASGGAVGPPLEGHNGTVWAVAFSPDGMRVVSGSSDRTLRLWDAASGAAVGPPIEGHEDKVWAVAFSPDGTRIVSGSEDRTLRLWDAVSGAAVGPPIEGHSDWVNAVAFSPDGTRIVSGSSDRTLRLWDAASGAAAGPPIEGHGDRVWAVAFSPDGTRIISGSEDRTLRLWDTAVGTAVGPPVEGHDNTVNAVAFSPDGTRIVSGSSDSRLRLWDAASGAAVGPPLEGHRGPVNAVAFSPDGTRIVSGSYDSRLRRWDAVSGAAVGPSIGGYGGEVKGVAFSPDGMRIVSGSNDNRLRLWDAVSGAELEPPLEGHRGPVKAVAFSPDGTRIVSGSEDRTLRLWDAVSGAAVGPPVEGHDNTVNAVAFSPDGTRIVSGSEDRTLRVWDVASGAEVARFDGEAGINAIAVTRDILAAGDSVGRVHILDWIPDADAKAAWLGRFDRPFHNTVIGRSSTLPPGDITAVPPEMQVTAAQLADVRFLETYRGRHLFSLADGRVYLDGLIAVGSLDHARATLDHMARHQSDEVTNQ